MDIALFDILGILFFACVAAYIYKAGWFFSFYSFFKFFIVGILSFVGGLIIAPHLPNFLSVTSLQFSLIIQAVLFIILWKVINFKKIFFTITDRVIPINRFVFRTKLDKLLNLFPSLIVAFFFTFFIFTWLVSISTRHPDLQRAIESSEIVKPLAYNIYFASTSGDTSKLFQGVAYNLPPSVAFVVGEDRLEESIPAEQTPSGGTKAFTPDRSQIIVLVTPAPVQQNQQQELVSPTPTPTQIPEPTQAPIFRIPIIFESAPTPIPTPQTIYFEQNTVSQIITPAPTTAPQVSIPIVAPPLNIASVEQDIFRLTNEQRSKNGVVPFVWDDALAIVARLHSQDMSSRGFFSHITPEGIDPFARMRRAGINPGAGAENIAGAPTADMIVANWMNSPGHRANILNPAFRKLGVGAATNSQYGILATQTFTN